MSRSPGDWPFRLCPACGSASLTLTDGRRFHCAACGLVYYHNVAVGAGVLILVQRKLLLLRRGHDPGRGLFTVPGGFVDGGESAETAAVRECREETGIEISPESLTYLLSSPNKYLFGSIPYQVCDIFFYVRLENAIPRLDGVEAVESRLVDPAELDPALLAFPSTRRAVEKLAAILRA